MNQRQSRKTVLRFLLPGACAVPPAGGTMADLCRVDVYVKDMDGFNLIHNVRREYFPDPPPASTIVAVSGFIRII